MTKVRSRQRNISLHSKSTLIYLDSFHFKSISSVPLGRSLRVYEKYPFMVVFKDLLVHSSQKRKQNLPVFEKHCVQDIPLFLILLVIRIKFIITEGSSVYLYGGSQEHCHTNNTGLHAQESQAK